MDRGVLRVPFADTRGIFVNYCDTDVWVLEGDDCGGWSACYIVSVGEVK